PEPRSPRSAVRLDFESAIGRRFPATCRTGNPCDPQIVRGAGLAERNAADDDELRPIGRNSLSRGRSGRTRYHLLVARHVFGKNAVGSPQYIQTPRDLVTRGQRDDRRGRTPPRDPRSRGPAIGKRG